MSFINAQATQIRKFEGYDAEIAYISERINILGSKISALKEKIFRIDPELLGQKRPLCSSRITAFFANICYSIKKVFHRCWGNLGLDLKLLNYFNCHLKEDLHYLDLLNDCKSAQFPSTPTSCSSTTCSEKSESRGSSFDAADDDTVSRSKLDCSSESSEGSYKENFKDELGSLLTTPKLKSQDVDFFLGHFFPAVSYYEKSIKDLAEGKIVYDVDFGSKHQIETTFMGYPAVFTAQKMIKLEIDPNGLTSTMHFDEGNLMADFKIKYGFISLNAKACLKSVTLEPHGVCRLAVEARDLSPTVERVMKGFGLEKNSMVKIKPHVFKEMFEGKTFTEVL